VIEASIRKLAFLTRVRSFASSTVINCHSPITPVDNVHPVVETPIETVRRRNHGEDIDARVSVYGCFTLVIQRSS
jgi:hypothetical protein